MIRLSQSVLISMGAVVMLIAANYTLTILGVA